jgi:small subunit ribosomal protein S11
MAKAAKATKAQAGGKTVAKKRIVKVDAYGDAHISATFNNLIVSLTNKQGQVISWSSAGKMGFRGSKKEYTLRSTNGSTGCSKKLRQMQASAKWMYM